MRGNKEKLVGCIFSSLSLHHSPHLSISWQGVINLILGEIQGSTFYTLRNLHRALYIVVILTLEERTKIPFPVLFLGTNVAKF